MKKVSIYSICIVGVIILFSLCYYASYQFALRDFNNNATKQEQSNASEELFEDSEDVGTKNDNIVSPDAKYVLQTYDMATKKTKEESLSMPSEFVGLTKDQVTANLSAKMQDISISEYNKGLKSYQLISFSSDKLVVKKTYNSEAIIYKYWMCTMDDEVVVYYSDQETVCERTGIVASELPDEDQNELKYGKFVEDEDELAGILESYTS